MKKRVFLYVLAFLLIFSLSYATVPDADFDGVPNENDNCPNSQTTTVDQFGCSCEQKNCASDNNPCTDDCSVINGLLSCVSTNNNNPCQGGYCINGVCQQTQSGMGTEDQNAIAQNEINIQGELEVLHFDDFNNPQNSKFVFYLRSGNKRYEIGDSKQFPQIPIVKSGAIVNVRGRISNDKILIDSANTNSFRLVSGAEPRAAAWSENLGPQSTLVIVASVGSSPPSADVNTARDLVFGGHSNTLNDYYVKNSLGQVSLTGRVVGQYSLPGGNIDVLTEAIEAADPYVNFQDYSRIILDIPNEACYGAAGAGTLGKIPIDTQDGQISASVSWDCYFDLYVVGHELGHNFGLAHANRMECWNCDSIEYGDNFDIMGHATRHLNAPHKEEAGWLSSNTIIATEGEYLIKPLEIKQPSGSVQQIKLPLTVKPDIYSDADNVYTTLEFRQPLDYDAGAENSVYSGVFIHLDADSRYDDGVWVYHTNLINFDQSTGFPPLLQVGRTFTDVRNGYEIALKSIDANGALVNIKRIPIERIPDFRISPTNILQGDTVNVIVNKAEPNSQILISLEDTINKKLLINQTLLSETDGSGYWSQDFDSTEWSPGSYRAWVNVAENPSNDVYFDVKRYSKRKPYLLIRPTQIRQGDKVEVTVLNATPKSEVIAYVTYGNSTGKGSLGVTDENGKWGDSYDSTGWAVGSYKAFVTVSEMRSNDVGFSVEGIIKTPKLEAFPQTINPGDKFYVTIGEAQPNSQILLYLHDASTGKVYINGDQLGTTNANGKWEESYDTTNWPATKYKAWVTVAGGRSNDVYFSVIKKKNPYLEVYPATINPGDKFRVTIGGGTSNSPIFLYLMNVNGQMLINGNQLGTTNADGKWEESFDTTGWPADNYEAWVVIGGGTSNVVWFEVKGVQKIPVISISPSSFKAGTWVSVAVTNAKSNSPINIYLQDASNYQMLINGDQLGVTDANGKWGQSFDTTRWTAKMYKSWVSVDGTSSNAIYFTVK